MAGGLREEHRCVLRSCARVLLGPRHAPYRGSIRPLGLEVASKLVEADHGLVADLFGGE